MVTIPERFEATITTLENTRDLSKITLAKLLNSLQAQEQRMVMRQEATVEEALPAKHEDGWRNKKKKNRKNLPTKKKHSKSPNGRMQWRRSCS